MRAGAKQHMETLERDASVLMARTVLPRTAGAGLPIGDERIHASGLSSFGARRSEQ